MAAQSDTDGAADPNAPHQDIATHRASYDRFMYWMKVGAVVSFVTGAVVTVILAS